MSEFYEDMPKDFRMAVSVIQRYCQNENCSDYECSECPFPLSIIRCGDSLNSDDSLKEDEDKKDCFDCKFYDSNQFVCMYECSITCILDERKSFLECNDFVEGKYDEDELEKTNYR